MLESWYLFWPFPRFTFWGHASPSTSLRDLPRLLSSLAKEAHLSSRCHCRCEAPDWSGGINSVISLSEEKKSRGLSWRAMWPNCCGLASLGQRSLAGLCAEAAFPVAFFVVCGLAVLCQAQCSAKPSAPTWTGMKLWPWRAVGWQQRCVVGCREAVHCSSGSTAECTAEMVGLVLGSSSCVLNHSTVL